MPAVQVRLLWTILSPYVWDLKNDSRRECDAVFYCLVASSSVFECFIDGHHTHTIHTHSHTHTHTHTHIHTHTHRSCSNRTWKSWTPQTLSCGWKPCAASNTMSLAVRLRRRTWHCSELCRSKSRESGWEQSLIHVIMYKHASTCTLHICTWTCERVCIYMYTRTHTHTHTHTHAHIILADSAQP